ncbi:MAG: histidine phosphatase family protein, partial [Myxococcota bacterium]
MELILVRHAEPRAGESGDPDPNDPPLGSRGRAQAARVADWLARSSLDRVISSPLRRARETAEVTAERVGLSVA